MRTLRLILLALILAASTLFARTASPSAPWVDYASGEYDIFPNIVYATANATDLKLDLYRPRSHAIADADALSWRGVGGRNERT